MAEQVTEMAIKVDLQCRRCYKKIKKILCEISQVKDTTFDEKQNIVKIKVVGCDPEMVRGKICCKGGDIILRIDIIPPKPKKEEKPPPPVLGWPLGYVIRKVYVCTSCHIQGCGRFCPCNCHCEGPPMCADGCGRPAHECKCNRPPMCHGGCGRPVHECRCKRPLMCYDGCGRPVHECRCQRPIYQWCCDRCSYGNASSSCLQRCDYGRPPACTNAGYDCETPCSLM